MQFKAELAQKILNREKTQTRRPIRFPEHVVTSDDHQYLVETGTQVNSANRLILADTPIRTVLDKRCHKRYQVGQIYAVQPGRGKPGIGFVRLTALRLEDVRYISHADVKAEGFKEHADFFKIWCGFYDPSALKMHTEISNETVFEIAARLPVVAACNYLLDWSRALNKRDNAPYLAWVLDFELTAQR